jgi:formamidopyrimidine-DNA glycosylase
MPELPEVEVTARHISSALGRVRLIAHYESNKALRFPMPRQALDALVGAELRQVFRRAKFVLLEFDAGWLAIHLGMSGCLEVRTANALSMPHDHLGLRFEPCLERQASGSNDQSSRNTDHPILVLNDPRRFGSVQWLPRHSVADPAQIAGQLSAGSGGLEPFDPQFNGDYLVRTAKGKATPIKPWLMQGQVVVGVGNIYACEALFAAGIHPARAAGRIAGVRFSRLADEIRKILSAAIDAGGSTIRDFQGADGQPGRYGQVHRVYGRQGQPCPVCATTVRRIVQAQRSTFYCHVCQR